jgi:hypothetical protein
MIFIGFAWWKTRCYFIWHIQFDFRLVRTRNISFLQKYAYSFRLSIEQRTVVRFFTLKRLNPEDIHTELLWVSGPNIFALLMVYKWHQRFVNGRTELCNDSWSGRPLRNDLAQALSAMLQECSFASCKKLCVHFRIRTDMCLRILYDVLNREKFTLHWIPHPLDNNQRAERVTLSHWLLEVLKKDK